jgi:hypothetical protein
MLAGGRGGRGANKRALESQRMFGSEAKCMAVAGSGREEGGSDATRRFKRAFNVRPYL